MRTRMVSTALAGYELRDVDAEVRCLSSYLTLEHAILEAIRDGTVVKSARELVRISVCTYERDYEHCAHCSKCHPFFSLDRVFFLE